MRKCALLVTVAVGCGGAAATTDAPRAGGERDLKTELRRDRRTIRSLENEVALLRARLGDTSPPPPEAPPAEAGAPAPSPTSPYSVDEPLPETLGPSVPSVGDVGQDEVEVVYEGEAAATTAPAARPRIELREDSRSYAGPDPEAAPPPSRLPVLSGEVPTVDSQLRRARAAAPAVATRRPPSDPRGEYQRYLDAARGGNHEYAAQGLRAFLNQNPHHELADNAQYWLAETFYGRKRYALALIEFEKVVERYPRGNKLPDALLKVGYCRAQLGKRSQAVAALRRLIRTFPGSGPAALARTKLEELQ